MTRNQVLVLLNKSSGYISGEQMSQELHISRAAVHQAIKSLRNEGYIIDSITNKGYCLQSSPDHITLTELSVLLPEERIQNIEYFQSIHSTNTYCSLRAQQGAEQGLIILADHQSAGKGRLGRSFHSPEHCGIYCSYLMRPKTPPVDTSFMTAWVAVAVIRAIVEVYDVQPSIKWVNDILLNHRKIGGILTEMSIEPESGHIQHLIVGVGLNVLHQSSDFPEDLQSIASSLWLETGKKIPRATLTAALIQSLDRLCADWPGEAPAYFQQYREHCISLGREVQVLRQGIRSRGHAIDIDESFGLIIEFPNGSRETVRSGEVQVRGLSGYV